MKSKAFYGVVNAKRVCIEGTYGKRHWGRMSGRVKKRINLFGLILLVLRIKDGLTRSLMIRHITIEAMIKNELDFNV